MFVRVFTLLLIKLKTPVGVNVCCRECAVNAPTEVDQDLWKEILSWESSAHLPVDSFLSGAVDTVNAKKSQEFGNS